MKERIYESRIDFSGGLNVSAPVDTLNDNELHECTNVRIEPHGGLIRRLGSRKLNTTALDGPIVGVYQWRTELGFAHETKLMANTYTTQYIGEEPFGVFNAIAGALTTNTVHVDDFALFADATFGSFSTNVYFTHGSEAYRTNGISRVKISDSLGCPGTPIAIRAFGNRIFLIDLLEATTLYWSKIGNGSDFQTGGVSDGGFASVGNHPLRALETISSSLLIGAYDSISRFTGVGADIQILTDTFGVSTDVGPLVVGSMGRADQFAVFWSDRGPYVVTEGGTMFIGEKIHTFSASDLQILPDLPPLVGHNRRRKELWFAYVPSDSGSPPSRTSVLVYNYQMQCWYGRFRYPFSITSLGRYEDAVGTEGIMAGCSDGFVRVLDDVSSGSLDDDIHDYTAIVRFPPFGIKGKGPYDVKAIERIYLQVLGLSKFDVNIVGDFGATEHAEFVREEQ